MSNLVEAIDGMTISLHRWTVEDYHRIVATGVLADHRCELLQGEVVEMAPEGPVHAHRCEMAARYLEQCFGTGWWARQGKPITLTNSEPEPDVAIVQERDYSDRHPLSEEVLLVVEYSSTTQIKDTGIKRDIYAAAAIPHYLVIDLKAITATYYSCPIAGQYTSEQTLQQGVIKIGQAQVDLKRLL